MDTYLYIDTDFCDDPEAVHFKMTIAPQHNEECVSVVFEILLAAQLLFALPATRVICAVTSTPSGNLPDDWRPTRLCKSPMELQELLDAEVQAHAKSLKRFRHKVEQQPNRLN